MDHAYEHLLVRRMYLLLLTQTHQESHVKKTLNVEAH